MAEQQKSGKMTVFKSDRHEDLMAIYFVTFVVLATLGYMAFIVPSVNFKAPSDGKILSIAVKPGQTIQKGEVLMSLEVKEKKMVEGKLEEKLSKKDIKSKVNGKILEVKAKEGDAKKKGEAVMVIEHEKGTLP